MAPGLRSSIRLKVLKPTDMNRACITTVAAMSPADKTKRKDIDVYSLSCSGSRVLILLPQPTRD